MQDSDDILAEFFQLCYQVGKERCPFWFDSVDAIRSAYYEINDRLRKEPLPLPISGNILEWRFFHTYILSALYDPFSTFPVLAQAFATLYNGTFSQSGLETLIFPSPSTVPTLVDPVSNMTNGLESMSIINCGDRTEYVTQDLAQLQSILESDEVRSVSEWAPTVVAANQAVCGRMSNPSNSPTYLSKQFSVAIG